MKSLLSAHDHFGTRWSYDRTISVRNMPNGYIVQDAIARTTHTRQSLDSARQVVRQILEQRPQIGWRDVWKRTGHPQRPGTSWQIRSEDGVIFVWIERLPEEWWSIEINIEGRAYCYSWRVEGHHPISVVQAQALAWAAHRMVNEESP